MGTSAQDIIESFDRLPDAEKQEVASEILRRARGLNISPPPDEEPAAEASETALLSERALAEDWSRPEEEEAWSHLQRAQ
jgi:hypothetical protein